MAENDCGPETARRIYAAARPGHNAEKDAAGHNGRHQRALTELPGDAFLRVAEAQVDAREIHDRQQRSADKLVKIGLCDRYEIRLLRADDRSSVSLWRQR